MQWKAYLGLLPFIGSVALAMLIILYYRKFKKLRERRSPLANKKIGHIPGQQLVDRMSDHETEMVLGFMLMCMAFPLMFLAWAGQRVDLSKVRWGFVEILYVLASIALFAYGFRNYKRNLDARDKTRDGLLAERVTGIQLNRLVAQGCFVLHDLPSDVGNIDHVVVAPQGVFAIETKSFRKPKGEGENHRVRYDGKALHFPDFVNVDAVAQAERSAQWVQRYLREKEAPSAPVMAALALPGWYVERTDSAKGVAVRVFTPMGRGADFLANPPERLNKDQRSLIAQLLALKYPEIAD